MALEDRDSYYEELKTNNLREGETWLSCLHYLKIIQKKKNNCPVVSKRRPITNNDRSHNTPAKVPCCQRGEYISAIFIRQKPRGSCRLILNLKNLNEDMLYIILKWKHCSQFYHSLLQDAI